MEWWRSPKRPNDQFRIMNKPGPACLTASKLYVSIFRSSYSLRLKSFQIFLHFDATTYRGNQRCTRNQQSPKYTCHDQIHDQQRLRLFIIHIHRRKLWDVQ